MTTIVAMASGAATRADPLTKVVRGLSAASADIEAAAVIDGDGAVMASSLPQATSDAVAAMSSALLGLSERIVDEIGGGGYECTILRGARGYTVLTRVGFEVMLVVVTTSTAKLGMVLLDVQRAAKDVYRVLS